LLKVSKRAVKQALIKSGGIVSEAAKLLGVNRDAVYKRIKNHEDLQLALATAEESCLDNAESKLQDLINNRQFMAIQFYLKTKGQKRGYGEKTEQIHTGTIALEKKQDYSTWKVEDLEKLEQILNRYPDEITPKALTS